MNEMPELLKFNNECSLSVMFKTMIFLSLKCFPSDFFHFLSPEISPAVKKKNKGHCIMVSDYRLQTLLVSVHQEVFEHRYSCLFFLAK